MVSDILITCMFTASFPLCKLKHNMNFAVCLSVLQHDLQTFKGGISQDVMAATVQRGVGTHYQIIGHKLYREQNCMFPAR